MEAFFHLLNCLTTRRPAKSGSTVSRQSSSKIRFHAGAVSLPAKVPFHAHVLRDFSDAQAWVEIQDLPNEIG